MSTTAPDALLFGTDPRTGERVGDGVPETPAEEVARLAGEAARAAAVLADPAAFDLPRRAGLLRAVADILDAHAAELVALADRETALGSPRLPGEVARTTGQLRLLADRVEAGDVLDVIAETADPGASPTPRPELYHTARPIGPVAVYAASNFPFAFSVAGGDTASALAAGCPVIVKAHPGHPATSARTAELVAEALAGAGAPAGTFAVVHGMAAGVALINDPRIRAGAFTGSVRGGRALFDLAAARPEPVPFYGELGSVNPVYATPAAAYTRGKDLASGFAASFTLGTGQFCTKPGLLFLPADHGLEQALADAVAAVAPMAMLTGGMREAYERGTDALAAVPGVRLLARGAEPAEGAPGHAVGARLYATTARNLAERPELAEEVFGPVSLVVEYEDVEELCAAAEAAPGSLTATVHAEPGDTALAGRLVALASGHAGRVLWNGWPTGVAVSLAQHHGGPWPATTAPLHTSVGATAVRRFLVPVVFQDVPRDVAAAAVPLLSASRADG